MKTYTIFIPILPFIIIINSSCTSTIRFTVKYPSEINLAEENKTVVIVNNLDTEALGDLESSKHWRYRSGSFNMNNFLTKPQ